MTAGTDNATPIVVGVNHVTANVALRDRLIFPVDRVPEFSSRLTADPAITETVVLSTCNRIEVYAMTDAPAEAVQSISSLWSQTCDVTIEEIKSHSYCQRGIDAIRHIFRVACSLDSLVLGESQIFGQVKDAFAAARDHGTVDFYFNHLLKETSRVGKRIRAETAINEGAVSISFAAVRLARKVLGDLTTHTAGIIGSGDMGRLAAEHLQKEGVHAFSIFNRSLGAAEELAARLGGAAWPLEEVANRLHECDVVVSATDAPTTILSKDHVARAMSRRHGRPLFLIDIAAPSDIDNEAGTLDDVFLFTIDDLKQVVRDNEAQRHEAVAAAEKIIAEELETIVAWQKELQIRSTIIKLRQKYDSIAAVEIADATRNMSTEEAQRLKVFGESLLNKFLHAPLNQLKGMSENGDAKSASYYADLIFGLEQNEDPGEQNG